jgi:ubiquinone/menaquinone biosynthesis C-methylase UbiE
LETYQNNKNEIFNEIANDYRGIHTENLKLSGETSEYFAEYKILELRNSDILTEPFNLLDIGCGDGISAVFFQKYYASFEYNGIDVSSESIKIASEKGIPNCKFETYTGKTIPFSDNKFQHIFLSCVMHHIDHSEHVNLLKECLRVLKPGGMIIIFEHNPWNPLTLKIVNNCVFDNDAVLINARKLKQTLRISGFNNANTRFTLFMPRKGVFQKILILEKYLKWIPIGGQYYITAKK